MKYIRWFSELSADQVALVGGKNASLGELVSSLTRNGVKVPDGFAITAEAYNYYLTHNKLADRIRELLNALPPGDVTTLASTGARLRQWIMHAEMPKELGEEICAAYEELARRYSPDPDVAVRSSATAEDLPDASFAGQQETYLNIRGSTNLLASCKRVFASLFTDRAISYRIHQGFADVPIALSIGVQKMIRADKGAAGVMFSLDTETGFRGVVFISAAYGLGENVVQGTVNPDEFYVFKPTLALGHRPIVSRHLGRKSSKIIYTEDSVAGLSTRTVRVKHEERERFAISDDEILELARYAVLIEQHYSERMGHYVAMDIEWAKDGEDGDLYILQARPETVQIHKNKFIYEQYRLHETGKVITTGKSVGNKIAAGKAHVIYDASDMAELQPGEILITDITDPDWEPVMKIAAAIVTNRGGRTCHAAIVARELGIPAVVGCTDATKIIRSGDKITVSCAEGNTGYVYEGILKYEKHRIELIEKEKPKTKLMLNLGNPEKAFELQQLPCAGVGLARLEFIINSSIRVHPQALLEYDGLDGVLQTAIDKACIGYPSREQFYIGRLAEGVGTIACAFYPRPVIARLSDFKSNEYASLIGGAEFEPTEENPMLGFRGASRYPSDQFSACFALECAAMKKVRNEMGLTNLALMIPFVRTVAEGCRVLELMAKHGLSRGENGLKIYLMCEIPANALLADEFLEHFDGFSIGSNDLTQLTLGVDRDSTLVEAFDERNEAVLALMEMAISACRKHKKYVGICGQAPSDYPEIVRWLVLQGIESMSLNPDSFINTYRMVVDVEREASKKIESV